MKPLGISLKLIAVAAVILGTVWLVQDLNRREFRPVRTSPAPVQFLTRDGCVNSPELLKNLKLAVSSFDPPPEYEVVDQGLLANTDARTGYTTPTILFDGEDIFGLPKPVPPFAAPS